MTMGRWDRIALNITLATGAAPLVVGCWSGLLAMVVITSPLVAAASGVDMVTQSPIADVVATVETFSSAQSPREGTVLPSPLIWSPLERNEWATTSIGGLEEAPTIRGLEPARSDGRAAVPGPARFEDADNPESWCCWHRQAASLRATVDLRRHEGVGPAPPVDVVVVDSVTGEDARRDDATTVHVSSSLVSDGSEEGREVGRVRWAALPGWLQRIDTPVAAPAAGDVDRLWWAFDAPRHVPRDVDCATPDTGKRHLFEYGETRDDHNDATSTRGAFEPQMATHVASGDRGLIRDKLQPSVFAVSTELLHQRSHQRQDGASSRDAWGDVAPRSDDEAHVVNDEVDRLETILEPPQGAVEAHGA